MTHPLVQIASRWELEVLAPGDANSQVVTQCASIRIRNTSATRPLELAPLNSSYRLTVPAGGVWGIDLNDVRDKLETVIIVLTAAHDAPVIVERIFKHVV